MALNSPFMPIQYSFPSWLNPSLALATAATLVLSSPGTFYVKEQTLFVNSAYQTTHEVVARYLTAVEAREKVIREAGLDKVAHIEKSLIPDRKAFVKAIQRFIAHKSISNLF
jgi:D-tyrosyl-tRNA(Tyr) deacylase